MEQHDLEFSLIAEGASEKILQFLMSLSHFTRTTFVLRKKTLLFEHWRLFKTINMLATVLFKCSIYLELPFLSLLLNNIKMCGSIVEELEEEIERA
jgi:hypothetical protein